MTGSPPGDAAGVIYDFIDVVRLNGVAVSISETQDALRAVSMVGFEQPERVRAALAATLAKTPEDRAAVDHLFRLYFNYQADELIDQDEDDLAEEAAAPRPGDQPQVDLQQLAGNMGGLAGRIAMGDQAAVEMAIRAAARDIPVEQLRHFWQEGFFTYRLLEILDQEGARDEVRELIQELEWNGGAAERDAAEVLQQRLQAFEQQVRQFVRRQLRQQDLFAVQRFRRESLRRTSFRKASQEELYLMRREVERMARRLRTRVSLRRRRARSGQLHLQETVRANLQTSLVPFRLRYRRKKKNRPELVVWFDLSESVRAVSEFTLMFVYALQDLFQKVRSFGFVADTVELTDLFRFNDFDEALRRVMAADVINVYRHSDYGEALRQFWTKYPDAVRPQTILIVLGDGRSNYQNHEPELMRQIARRAKHTLWMNPEPRNSWGLGDSVMHDYLRHFREAAVVSNLRELEKVVDQLATRLW
ncbi:MAG: VWA domain-containing protein [Candidatus Dadabacteria bacterium]|nr:MAG: VWA domain-containing protein [Candidatus Dadabacteria bacterium]